MAEAKICAVDGCGKKHEAKGFCTRHYYRYRMHGDPLGGNTAHGEPSRFIHEVALNHRSQECLIWPFSTRHGGRGQVWVGGEVLIAPRYICELAHGEPPTPRHDAAHNCGKGHLGCVSPVHLEWKTHADNEADKLVHGTHNRGEGSSSAKLTERDVREIRDLKGIMFQRDIADKFNVSIGTVASIHQGIRWSWL